MQILVAGFDRQKFVSRDDVITALLRLPELHLRGIKVVRYDPNRIIATTMTWLTDEPLPPGTRGSYYQSENMSAIVVWNFSSREEFYHILYHEVGHYVFMRTLRQHQRDQWMKEIRPREPQTVSTYARKNSREDFSESYAAWVNKDPSLDKCPLRKAFIKHEVFAE
ncbi:MAG: hypothetical protein O7C75_18330 [Verrucomicrobia bacterium]|nr:hypothetical protein [Verrucomicrobiota bacterium]